MATTVYAALQAATILVAMASEKQNWRLKFRFKSPIGNQRISKYITCQLTFTDQMFFTTTVFTGGGRQKATD